MADIVKIGVARVHLCVCNTLCRSLSLVYRFLRASAQRRPSKLVVTEPRTSKTASGGPNANLKPTRERSRFVETGAGDHLRCEWLKPFYDEWLGSRGQDIHICDERGLWARKSAASSAVAK